MINAKRFLIAFVIICIISTFGAAADSSSITSATITEKDFAVSIEGVCSEFNAPIVVRVDAPDGSLYHIRQITSGADGSFSYSFSLDGMNDASGKYSVKLTTTDLNSEYSESFTFLSQADINLITGKINSSENITEIRNVLQEYYSILGLADDQSLATILFEQKPYENTYAVSEMYGYAEGLIEAISDMNWSAVVDFFAEGEEITNGEILFNNNSDYEAFCDYKTAAQKAIVKIFAEDFPYDNIEELRDGLADSIDEYESTAKTSSGSGGGGGGAGAKTITSSTKSSIVKVEDSPKEIITPEKETPSYIDIADGMWAEKEIYDLLDSGVLTMPEDKMFNPDAKITRAEFVKMLVISAGILNENAVCDFADVSSDSWEYKYVASAYESGIVNGREDKSFGAGDNITREEMAAMMLRAVKFDEISADAVFTDDAAISDYAKTAVYTLKAKGVLNGNPDGSFAPKAYASRCESAVIMYRMRTSTKEAK